MSDKISVHRSDLGVLLETIRLLLNDVRKEDITASTAKVLTGAFDVAGSLVGLEVPENVRNEVAELIAAEPGKPKLSAQEIRKLGDAMMVVFHYIDFVRMRREDKFALLEGMQLATKITPSPLIGGINLSRRVQTLLDDLKAQPRGPGEAA